MERELQDNKNYNILNLITFNRETHTIKQKRSIQTIHVYFIHADIVDYITTLVIDLLD